MYKALGREKYHHRIKTCFIFFVENLRRQHLQRLRYKAIRRSKDNSNRVLCTTQCDWWCTSVELYKLTWFCFKYFEKKKFKLMFYHSFLLKIQVENLCFVNWTAGLAYHVYNYVVISHLWACFVGGECGARGRFAYHVPNALQNSLSFSQNIVVSAEQGLYKAVGLSCLVEARCA